MTPRIERPGTAPEKSAAQMREEHDAWRDGQQMTVRCAARGCGWRRTGAAAEMREAAREHRRREHPELERSPRRKLTPAQQRQVAMARSEWKRRKFSGEE